jgi:cytochrome c-type biogenesis protein CcmH/NrfF
MNSQNSIPNRTGENEAVRGAAENELARTRRLNRRLTVVCVALGLLLTGVAGYLLGARQSSTTLTERMSLPAAVSPLLEGKRALLEGIRCSHGNPAADAQCETAIEMRRYILTLLQQGDTDEKIKAALLRKYGEAALAGRRW